MILHVPRCYKHQFLYTNYKHVTCTSPLLLLTSEILVGSRVDLLVLLEDQSLGLSLNISLLVEVVGDLHASIGHKTGESRSEDSLRGGELHPPLVERHWVSTVATVATVATGRRSGADNSRQITIR